MYSVVDFNTVPKIETKEQAFVCLDELRLNNPDADWHPVGTVIETNDNDVLERLYALCHQLLAVSRINPVKLEMKLTNLLGEETTYTAARIMIDARAKLDE